MGCNQSSSENTIISSNARKQLLLGYWNIPLRAQPIRYILELAQYPYSEKKYSQKEAQEWFGNDKQNLGLEFPNLPYIFHGDYHLTEASNIANYVLEITCQQYLLGCGDDKFRIGNIRYVCDGLIIDVFKTLKMTPEEKQKLLENNIIPDLYSLKEALGEKTYFFGRLTVADIYAYCAFVNFKLFFPNEYKQFASSFNNLIINFEAIPEIQAYQKSDRFPKFQL
ncbi:glutathione S-transferase, amine-terminal domain protein (macronuclear) [Tetrahymena thermophila SB210]|uniref:glutathione transferase n=1 Tax=Tetrahymena thermophila (strain SB210) TaxID=312017 RepID=Q23J85_TETTS|nr:glutathione S-transferase, amine-terminal domain protein [Tetrahymena thermophila SB210]EAR96619.1 glutathione S-transferase, amine-terminal domain protein [Tetrahymena thermophila SB210]|eukprot:XP_001016864.1 glutathione S-transferase, amine-terminal domain protein [Tetrahymena thermophila SB210]